MIMQRLGYVEIQHVVLVLLLLGNCSRLVLGSLAGSIVAGTGGIRSLARHRHQERRRLLPNRRDERNRICNGNDDIYGNDVVFASSAARARAVDVANKSATSSLSSPVEPPRLTYADLSPLGKAVAGTVEVCIATALEYVSGFMGGYFLGTVTDVPRWLLRPVEDVERKLLPQVWARSQRLHAKSYRWAKSWAGISAAFGGFRVATKVLRSGREDEWNTVLSSMAAGAFFARKEGPQAMMRGAVTYGALVYLISGGLSGAKKEPFAYNEERVDF